MDHQTNELPVANYYHGSDSSLVWVIRLFGVYGMISGGARLLEMATFMSLFSVRPGILGPYGMGMNFLSWAMYWPPALVLLIASFGCLWPSRFGRVMMLVSAIVGMLFGLAMPILMAASYLTMRSYPAGFLAPNLIRMGTSALASFAMPIMILLFFTRAEVKRAMER